MEDGPEHADVPEEDVPIVGGGPKELVLVPGHAQDILRVEGLPVVAQEHQLGLVEPAHMARGRRAESSALLVSWETIMASRLWSADPEEDTAEEV